MQVKRKTEKRTQNIKSMDKNIIIYPQTTERIEYDSIRPPNFIEMSEVQ